MTRFKETIGPRGLTIPKGVLEQEGWPEGTTVVIEKDLEGLRLVPETPTQERIRRQALRYVLHQVGDATAVRPPVWNGETWTVAVWLPYRQRELGQLFFSAGGELLPVKSSSPESMIEKAGAS